MFVVPYSPHDHTIMFQSKEGYAAIFGDGLNKKYANNIHRVANMLKLEHQQQQQ